MYQICCLVADTSIVISTCDHAPRPFPTSFAQGVVHVVWPMEAIRWLPANPIHTRQSVLSSSSVVEEMMEGKLPERKEVTYTILVWISSELWNIMPHSNPTTGPYNFSTSKISWAKDRAFFLINRRTPHGPCAMSERVSYKPRRESSMFFIAYVARTDPQGYNMAPLCGPVRDLTQPKIPKPTQASDLAVWSPQWLFTGCLRSLTSYMARKAVMHTLKT